MQIFQCLLLVLKQSYICYCIICMTVPLSKKNVYVLILSQRKPKLSRHTKLNHRNISLLLQEAIQKYQKLPNYWTTPCSVFAFLYAYYRLCFLSPSSTAEFLNFTSDHSCQMHFRFLAENGFLQVKPARCHCLHNKTVFTITSIIQVFLFYKFFGTNLAWIRNSSTIFRSSHQRCSIKKLFWKNLWYSKENTCVRVSFLLKLQAFTPLTVLKKGL